MIIIICGLEDVFVAYHSYNFGNNQTNIVFRFIFCNCQAPGPLLGPGQGPGQGQGLGLGLGQGPGQCP